MATRPARKAAPKTGAKPAAKHATTAASASDGPPASAGADADGPSAPPARGTDAAGPQSLRDQRRREKDRVSRNHILDAAERIFGQKGFHDATLKEVADQAEFSVGALYAFFEGKDDLFAQVVERQGGALLAAMEAAVAGAGTAREKLHALADTSLAYFRERPDFYRLYQRELGGATWAMRATLNEAGLARYREVMSFEEAIFAAGAAAGELLADDPEVMAALFTGIVQAYIAQWVFALGDDGRSTVDDAYPIVRLHDLIDRAFLPA